ncbi:MAG TPA: hypothetical protein VF193_16180 [Steroidobacter sp.]
MKSKGEWRRHLRELVNAGLDPMVYALQWAHDPRCMQRGYRHRRVGAFSDRSPVCKLWLRSSGWS